MDTGRHKLSVQPGSGALLAVKKVASVRATASVRQIGLPHGARMMHRAR